MQTPFSQLHTIIDYSSVLAGRLLFPTSNWHKRATKRLDVAKLRWVDASLLATIGDPLRHPARCLSIALLQKPNEDQTSCRLQGACDGMRQTSRWSTILNHRHFADLSMNQRVLGLCLLNTLELEIIIAWPVSRSVIQMTLHHPGSLCSPILLHYSNLPRVPQSLHHRVGSVQPVSWQPNLDQQLLTSVTGRIHLLPWTFFSDSMVSKLRIFWDVKTQHRV